MPHVTLEYTDNISVQVDAKEFFAGLQEVIKGFEAFRASRTKSRVIRHHEYFIDGGEPADGFVYLQIAILSGRSKEIRQELSRSALDYLVKYFAESTREKACSIAVEIREIEESTFLSMSRSNARG
jgi:5-carboxymethyl-2-hydroxymuconate isomerase